VTVPEAVTLLAAVGSLIVATCGAFVSVWNAVHLASVHTIVNSQATKFEALAKQAGFAEGTRTNLLVAPTRGHHKGPTTDLHSS
jgi:hypothetical protein